MATSAQSHSVSEAKVEANRRNAKLSSGPRTSAGKARSRLNALKHGLTARVAWPGQDAQRNQKFFRFAWERLGPRNGLEETCVGNLLQTRLREDYLLDAERVILTRRPLLYTLNDGQPYTFLYDEKSLETLEQFARHLTHLSRLFEKDVRALLRVRRENWGERLKQTPVIDAIETLGAATSVGPVTGDERVTVPPVDEGSLEHCLADDRLVLPGEDVVAYRSLVRELWVTLAPTSLMEGFVACDYVQSQWRLDRVLEILRVLLEASAVSATGEDLGFGFGFVHDSLRGRALEPLRLYEAALRKRLDGRLALFRTLRKEGWQDVAVPDSQPPTDLPSNTPVAPTRPTGAPTKEVPSKPAE